MHQNFNLAKPRASFCLIQSALSFYVPHPVLCSTRLCPCFWLLVLFTLSQFTPILSCCQHSHLPSANAFFFSRFFEFFSRFLRFFEILQDFRYFSFLFLSCRVKNHICILWNPNICFHNNNNNSNNNNNNNNNKAIGLFLRHNMFSFPFKFFSSVAN